MKTTVSSIDFGTSKIVTMVAENSSATRCDIIGAGIVSYNGFLSTGWNNPAEIDDCIREALSQAEKQSKHKIREVSVGVPGAFTKVYITEAHVTLNGTDPHVTAADVRAVFKQAADDLRINELEGALLHSSPAWFRVDGGKKTLHPVGVKGRELTALISFIVGERYFLDDLTARMVNLDIKVRNFFSTPVGEALLYVPEQDRDRTAVLIDVGYLSTEVMAVEGDAIIYHKVLDVGGGHISADLSEQLDIPFGVAEEKIKKVFPFTTPAQEETYEVAAIPGQPGRSFTRAQVAPIITARVDAMMDEIKAALDESGVRITAQTPTYMAGGGLIINHGARNYLAGKLGRPLMELPKRSVRMSSPNYASSLGLMDLIVDTIEQQHQPAKGVVGGLKNFFKSLVGA